MSEHASRSASMSGRVLPIDMMYCRFSSRGQSIFLPLMTSTVNCTSNEVSMAAPMISPSPWAACPSPIMKSAPRSNTGKYMVTPSTTSLKSMLAPWVPGTSVLMHSSPYGKECISSLVPGTHGANMDFNEVVEGVTMYFPVFERGALFMIGDGHAAQGDGEIMGAAIETSFDVQFTVEVIKGKKIDWPRLENQQYIMSIGSTRPLMDALRLACSDMINWLATDYGYDRIDAYELLGQTAVIKIANVVDPQYSVACALDKKYLPK